MMEAWAAHVCGLSNCLTVTQKIKLKDIQARYFYRTLNP